MEQQWLTDNKFSFVRRREELSVKREHRLKRMSELSDKLFKDKLSMFDDEDEIRNEYLEILHDIGNDRHDNDEWIMRAEQLSHARQFILHMDSIDARNDYEQFVGKRFGRDASAELGEIPWVSLN